METMLRLSISVVSILLASFLLGQEWKVDTSIELPSEASAYSVDIQDRIYIGFEDGQMLTYDDTGVEIQHYSFSNLSSIGLIEAQNYLKIFLFFFDIQQIAILDRFSTVPKTYPLRDYGINMGMMACPAPDQTIWVVENNPQRLKKIDPGRQTTLIEVQTTIGDTISFMRTYKNLLLITDGQDLHIYDQFGSLVNRIKDLKINYCQIYEGVLIATDGQNILEIDPFKGTVLSKIQMPISHIDAAIRTSRGLILVEKDQMHFLSK